MLRNNKTYYLNTGDKYDEWENNKQDKFDVVTTTTGFSLCVGGKLFASIQKTRFKNIVTGLLSSIINGPVGTFIDVSLNVASLVALLLFDNPYDVSKANLREFLINAKAGFEVGKGST